MSADEHLRCRDCGEHPTIARLDGVTHIVCHCTHVDGAAESVAIAGLLSPYPERWAFESHGGEQ